MYLALVTPKIAGTVYNPILVSADFDQKASDDSTAIDASTAKIVGTAVAKKEPVKLTKTEPKITNDIGDIYEYTIDTTIPAYSSAFTDQFFKVSDTVSQYLDIVDTSVVITGVTGGTVSVADDKHSFTVNFPHSVVSALTQATPIKIEYKAKLNIPASVAATLPNVKEEYNKVTITFPNDPNDLSGKKITAEKDETREYTFTIDGKIFGHSDWETSELVKVALNADGTYATEEINYQSGESHGPLEGARFALFTEETAAKNAINGSIDDTKLYKNDVFNGYVSSDAKGLLNIQGLDQGTYWLAELSAPAGYVKDQDAHKIVISAVIEEESYTEYYTYDANGNVTWHEDDTTGGVPYTYTVPVLKSYTVLVDDTNSSTYTMTLDGPSISELQKTVKDTELDNTKGTELPHTGGIGTTIFYIVGGILLIGAAVILVARRKAQD
jgi:fimbrial isopeptide formation D2 family protein/LPXTG-motif cell wall-anchored protein